MPTIGHTACLWQDKKLLIYGGENEHREHLSDVVIFDIETATWTSPAVSGPIPKGRCRHAATLYDEKLFVSGGLTGPHNDTLNDVCYLDLRTWTWSRSWRFVPRFDHSTWVWADRLWVFAGMGPDMERTGELWWLDLKSSPAFKGCPEVGNADHLSARPMQSRPGPTVPAVQNSSASNAIMNQANSRTAQAKPVTRPMAPGAIGSMRFHSGAKVPSFTAGIHFCSHFYGAMLYFATPAGPARLADLGVSAFELDAMRWQRLADGPETFDNAYRWSYLVMDEEGSRGWLIGTTFEYVENVNGTIEEYLSHVIPLDFTKYGLLGGGLSSNKFGPRRFPASDSCPTSTLSGPAVDLAGMFDRPLEAGCGSDFQITAVRDESSADEEDVLSLPDEPQGSSASGSTSSLHSPPINVHKLILLARWPHFTRAYAAQMVEFHSKKMHIPEPYSIVRAFLWYLYTDSIDTHPEYCPSLYEVAGMLVMANVYDMPRLRLLCGHRLSREMDVESAATIWEKAGLANDEWLRRRAAQYCLVHWGRLVRTQGFKRLSQGSMAELCEVIDIEGRVVGGDELEVVGGLGGGKFGFGGLGGGGGAGRGWGRRRSTGVTMSDGLELDGEEGEDDEAMEVS